MRQAAPAIVGEQPESVEVAIPSLAHDEGLQLREGRQGSRTPGLDLAARLAADSKGANAGVAEGKAYSLVLSEGPHDLHAGHVRTVDHQLRDVLRKASAAYHLDLEELGEYWEPPAPLDVREKDTAQRELLYRCEEAKNRLELAKQKSAPRSPTSLVILE